MVGSRKICRNFSPTGALFSVFLAGALLSVADSFAPAMGPNCLRQKDAAAGRACRPMFASSGLFRPEANSIAGAADARRLPAAVRGLSMAEGGGAAASKGKSVLIIAWFYAEPKQIELVKRIYKKKGFTDIVVQESPVKQISTPRGWYNTFVSCIRNGGPTVKGEGEDLKRSFDLVHCMSGGFLQLYLLLAAKMPIEFNRLVMDSTPILPQPKSFVRFARAYMMDNGLEIVPKLLPLSVHNAYQTARWSVGATYTRIKHKGFIKKQLKDLDSESFEETNRWTRWAARASAHAEYDVIVEDAIKTVFDRPGLHTTFMYNKNDAYINPDDIAYIIGKCKEFGNEADEVLTDTRHIETIFRKPKLLFEAIKDI